MGKNLIQQKRGKGSPRYIAPSHRWQESRYRDSITQPGRIVEFVDCDGHSAPLARIRYDDGEECLVVAVEGLRIGDAVGAQTHTEGSTMILQDIPEGTMICNIELQPGDGGKFVRAGGTCAKILTKTPEGVVAGGGRLEKPLLKAGKTFFIMQQKNKRWPLVSGNSMNAVSHPYGGKRKAHKGRPTIAPKNAPPGRNVGKLHPRRTGWKRK